MTIQEYNKILSDCKIEREQTLSVHDVQDKSDHTLLYGYTCDRHTFHVYIKDGILHKVIYAGHHDVTLLHHTSGTLFHFSSLIPDKRLYPAACDFQVSQYLQDSGVDLPWTTYEERKDIAFHGFTFEDIQECSKQQDVRQ